MKRDFARLAGRYGQDVCLREDGVDTLGRAFLQPLWEKDGERLPTPLGRRERGRFLCLAEPGLGLDRAGEEACLICGGRAFEIAAAQPVYFGADILFCWAVLKPRDEEGQA